MRPLSVLTKFERAAKRYQFGSEELKNWIFKNRNRYYIPESVLAQFNCKTEFDVKEPPSFSLANNVVIPEHASTEPETLVQL